MAALLSSAASPDALRHRSQALTSCPRSASPRLQNLSFYALRSKNRWDSRTVSRSAASDRVCEREKRLLVDRSAVVVKEFASDEELFAAVALRVRTFYNFNESSVGVEDQRRCLTEKEFEALRDRISGKSLAFKRVSCINASLPLSPPLSYVEDLCSKCKFFQDGEARVVVGSLDINQCLTLPDELTGKKPEVIKGDLPRAYLSNVCVAKELQRNGLAYALIAKSKSVARILGITDLYVHVAVDNEAAQQLYKKCGFIYEDEEPAWRARFLSRPRRFLLWTDLR